MLIDFHHPFQPNPLHILTKSSCEPLRNPNPTP
jgi:hypothetical protein